MLTKALRINANRLPGYRLLSSLLTETETVAAELSASSERLTIINAGLNMTNFDPRKAHIERRIPSAIFLHIDQIRDKMSYVPLMLPHVDDFRHDMRKLGIRKHDRLVIYDRETLHAAPRVFWMLKTYGATDVSILNGSCLKWRKEGRPMAGGNGPSAWAKPEGDRPFTDEDFNYELNPKYLVDFEELEKLSHKIINSKTPEEHKEAHVKGALNLAYNSVIDVETREYKSVEEIARLFREIGIKEPEKEPLTIHCQRGITACQLFFSLQMLGNDDVSVYDGSLAEYMERTAQ